jgi:hypothetical protein
MNPQGRHTKPVSRGFFNSQLSSALCAGLLVKEAYTIGGKYIQNNWYANLELSIPMAAKMCQFSACLYDLLPTNQPSRSDTED